jgi:hypothetical protein
MIIHSLKDRINVKIDEITVVISPLSYRQKAEVQSIIARYSVSKDSNDLIDGSFKALKYAVKDIKGAKNKDKSDYQIKLENGIAEDNSIEELLNSSISNKLTSVALSLLNGIPKEIINPMTGLPLEGVEIENF